MKTKSQAKKLKTVILSVRVPKNWNEELKKRAEILTKKSIKDSGVKTSVGEILRDIIRKDLIDYLKNNKE